MTLSVPAELTDSETQPVFNIKLTLSDNHPIDPLSRSYDITLVIVKDWTDPIIAIIATAKKNEVINTYEGRVYDLTSTSIESVTSLVATTEDILVPEYRLDFTSAELLILEQEKEQDEKLNPKPDPKIQSMSNDGKAGIKFNTPMKVPDLSQLGQSKVALRMTKAINVSDRVSDVKIEEYLTDDGIRQFEIRNAIEVKMEASDETEDPIEVNFSWEFTKFTPNEAEIQLYFELPEAVSASSSDPDNVVVTFWASDLFQAENGKQIRPGFTITAPVTRQVSVDDAKKYRNYGRCVGYVCLGFLVVGFLFSAKTNADTLPVWATYDILVMTTHLPLLNIAFPGSTSIFLSEMAKVFRLSFVPVDEWLIDSYDVGSGDKPLNNQFYLNGYKYSSILLNLGVFMCLFAILMVL